MEREGVLAGLSPPPRGVLFDFGNTLIPFGRREMDKINSALVEFFLTAIPGSSPEGVRQALDTVLVDLHRHRHDTNRESDPRDVIRRTFRAHGAVADEEDHVPRGLSTIRSAFVDSVVPGEGMEETLAGCRSMGLRVGLVSNYSLAAAIHDSVEKLGIRQYLDTVVVSGDIGVVKPHPTIFVEAARRLGLPPREILFVGDNPRADLAGASAVGMTTAWITEHLDGAYHFEHPEENVADVRPDLECERLVDLTNGDRP